MPPPGRGYPQSGGSYPRQPAPGSPTYTEAWALVEAARRMAMAIESGPLDNPDVRKAVRDALRLNWRLWTIFQTELSADESPVPIEIRQNMLSLSNFVDSHTVQTMADPSAEKIAILIEINRNIATGLLESLQASLQAAEAAQAQTKAPQAAGGKSGGKKESVPPEPPKPFNAEA
ncbi:MAG: flagellar biosynthesis regulator FlaF [Pseudomonadota bacterium]